MFIIVGKVLILREKCLFCGKSVNFAEQVFILQKKSSFCGKKVLIKKMSKNIQKNVRVKVGGRKKEEERGFIDVLFRT